MEETINKTILIVMAHPDDAELVMAGTLARFVSQGYKVCLLVLSLPTKSELRKEELRVAAQILGIEANLVNTKSKTWRAEDLPMHYLVSQIDIWMSNLRPVSVFTHWVNDTHNDHKITAKAVLASVRRGSTNIYMCATPYLTIPTSTTFEPNSFVDTSEWMKIAIESMRVYTSEPRILEYIEQATVRSRYYGKMINSEFADAFICIRQELII